MMDFHSWLAAKYWDWSNGGKKSVTQFAVAINISQATVSAWLNKTRTAPKSKELIDRLVSLYGAEVYEVLHLPQPSLLSVISQSFPHMSPDVAGRLAAAMSEINDRSAGLPDDDPRLDEIIRDALRQNGFRL